MRSASSFAHCTRYPPFSWGRALKRRRLEEASTHTHDANGYQATSSDRRFVYVSSVSSVVGGVGVAGHLVSHGTLEGTRGLEYASLGCGTPGQSKREGGLALTGSVKTHPTPHEPPWPCDGALSAGEYRL